MKILRYGMKFVCNLQCEYFFFVKAQKCAEIALDACYECKLSQCFGIYLYICVRKLMLSYLSAGLPVETFSKDQFGFLLLLFIWFRCRLVMRVGWR